MANPPTRANGSWTIGRLLAWTREHFEAHQVDEPRLAAELLLAEALGCRRIELYARIDHEPTAEQRAAFREHVRAAAEHHPIAYLIGRKEFYSLDFKVTPDVLIPRPETELLVERTLAWCRENPQDRYDLLDVGTGSGCIAVTLAKREQAAHVVATDRSAAALAVARENAARHGVADRVRCVTADLLDLPSDCLPPNGFDVIVSNPPYIGERERASLPRNVVDYEPAEALFSGEDGLDALRGLAGQGCRGLRPGGLMLVEVGHTQAAAVAALFADAGWEPAGRFKDLQGIERALAFRRPT